MNLTTYRTLKWLVEFHLAHGHYPFLGGSVRGREARELERSGYIVLDHERRQVTRVTARCIDELEEAPRASQEVRAARPTGREVFEQLEGLEGLHIRDLRLLAEVLNIPDRQKLRRRELVAALARARDLVREGWVLDTTVSFHQWHRNRQQGVTLSEALLLSEGQKLAARAQS